MSDRRYVIFIEPKLMADKKEAEHFQFKDMDCPSCNGDGYHSFWTGYHGSAKEKDSELCQRCAGTGKLMADVVIRWKPNEPKIEE